MARRLHWAISTMSQEIRVPMWLRLLPGVAGAPEGPKAGKPTEGPKLADPGWAGG